LSEYASKEPSEKVKDIMQLLVAMKKAGGKKKNEE